MADVAPDQLPLQRIYHWEKAHAAQVYLTQPVAGGAVLHYTWGDAVNQARHMTAYLKSRNFPPRSNIGILSKNCAHWLIADYAIWMAGHVSVPLYPTLTAESVRQILEHSEARALFVGKLDDWDKMKAGVPGAVHCIAMPLAPVTDFPKWDDIAACVEPMRDSPVRPGSDLATIIYTSGTTGMPKGVMQSFEALAWAVHAVQKRVGSVADDRMLSYLPLSHIAERVALEMGSLKSGFQIFFAESLDTFARDLQRARPTLFFSVPRLWVKFQQGVHAKMPKEKLERLLKVPLLGAYVRRKVLKGLGLDQCRRAFGGAAPMPPELLRWYQALGLGIIEVYGMTENAGVSHSTLPGQFQPGYVGLTYDGVEARLGPDNEVQTRSPATMLGYFKEPEKTREAITPDGWLRTGDKGQLDAQGSLRITGRVKDLFKTSKGKYVAPAPIEDKLVAHPKVEACCVAGANQGQPCALIMLSPDAMKEAQDKTRREALAQSLAEHLQKVNAVLDPHEQMDFVAVVSDAWTVEKGFVTPTMKVKRNVIENTYGKFFDAWYAKRQPVVWQ